MYDLPSGWVYSLILKVFCYGTTGIEEEDFLRQSTSTVGHLLQIVSSASADE